MPTSEDLAKWGAYELSFEELLEVNGGKRDRSGGRSGGGRSSRSSGSGGSSSKGSSGRGSNKSSGGGVKSKETNKDKRKGSKTHTGSTGTEGKKNGGLSGSGLKGGEPKSKEEKKSGSTDYTVRKGDTLSGIVRARYPGASKEEIAEKVKEVAKNSGIKDIDVIHPGDKIVFEKPTETSSGAGSAEANTGKEKGSAGGTTREGRSSTGSGFLRGGGYRQGAGRKTIGEQALPEQKGLSGIQQKVSIQGTMYKGARSKISGVFDRIRDAFGNVNKANAESYLGRRRGWGRRKETVEAQIQNVPKLSNEVIKKETLFSNTMIKQKELEQRYNYPNALCYATDIINVYREKKGLSDEDVDNFMKGAKDVYIKSNGEVPDFPKMSKAIAKEAKTDMYYDYVYSKENDWQLVKMDEEGFKSSNYEFGMGEYYKTGDEKQRTCHFKLVQNSPWQEHDPGAGIQEYTLSVIRPLQQLKLGD